MIQEYLPAKIDVLVFCSMTEEQQLAYDREVAEGRTELQQAERQGGEGAPVKLSSALKVE